MFDRARVQHRDCFVGNEEISVVLGVGRPIRCSIAQSIEGQDPVSLGQPRHLVPPEVAVHDAPLRHQQNDPVAGAELLPCNALAAHQHCPRGNRITFDQYDTPAHRRLASGEARV